MDWKPLYAAPLIAVKIAVILAHKLSILTVMDQFSYHLVLPDAYRVTITPI
jgi:hypothetical protein